MDRGTVAGKAVKAAAIFLVVAVLLAAGYTYGALHWAYSSGERVGYVQKFSKKGWLCKTWEGELTMSPVPGAVPEKFFFTVPDESLAQLMNQGMGKKVAIGYEQHRGVPTSCFGETEYFVIKAKFLE